MSTAYRRLTGCLSDADSTRLLRTLVAFRKATRQPCRIIRRRFERGWALFEMS